MSFLALLEESDSEVKRMFADARRGKFGRSVHKRKIDGRTYVNEKLPATEGVDLVPLITYLTAVSAEGDSFLGEAYDATAILAAFGKSARYFLGKSLKEGLIEPLFSELTIGAYPMKKEGGPVLEDFDMIFRGEYPHLFRVLMFTLIHNFAGFTLGSRSTGGSPKPTESLSDSKESDMPTSVPRSATFAVDLTGA